MVSKPKVDELSDTLPPLFLDIKLCPIAAVDYVNPSTSKD